MEGSLGAHVHSKCTSFFLVGGGSLFLVLLATSDIILTLDLTLHLTYIGLTTHLLLPFLLYSPNKQNGDYPFKMGTYMGCDAMGNRYYENNVDYPIGQHRWVEP